MEKWMKTKSRVDPTFLFFLSLSQSSIPWVDLPPTGPIYALRLFIPCIYFLTTPSMDRQALLEQKRQRLQELKQRRSELASLAASLPLKPPVPVKVDFAVQVDLPVHHAALPTQVLPVEVQTHVSEVVRFSKGVQTNFEDLPDPKEPESPDPAQPDTNIEEPQAVEARKPQQILEETLQEELNKAEVGFRFSDLRLGVKDPASVEHNEKEPFNSVPGLHGFLDRPISSVCTCAKFPNILLVAYGKSPTARRSDKITDSAGLAIVFNRDSDPMVPEFFLQCTGAITTIQFSNADPFKILAGLENGRIVIWDLTDIKPSQISVLPTLQTSTLMSLGETSRQKYLHHTSPIVQIQQLDLASLLSSGFVSVCAGGLLNLWSPNFLAFPKIDSVSLCGQSYKLRDQVTASDALLLSNPVRTIDEKHSVRSPELRFLNQIMISSKNGKIYRLSNNAEKGLIAHTYSDVVDDASVVFLSISCLAELRASATTSIIVSAHNDWQLRLWDLATSSPIASIPTSTVVTHIITRPGHPFQIITLGSVTPPKMRPSIQFWDLEAKLLGPVYTFPTQDLLSRATNATFTPDGGHLMVAFANGEVSIWEIEETRLQTQATLAANSNIDEGILPLIKFL